MKMKTGPILVAAPVFALYLGVGAYAHEGATGVVKERMEMMKGMAAAMKALAPMVQGKAEWDAKVAAESAGAIAKHATAMPEKFPKGSTGHPSEARADIWIKWQQFQLSADTLARDADALKAIAGNGVDAAKPLFAKIAQSCKGCHESFREKKQ